MNWVAILVSFLVGILITGIALPRIKRQIIVSYKLDLSQWIVASMLFYLIGIACIFAEYYFNERVKNGLFAGKQIWQLLTPWIEQGVLIPIIPFALTFVYYRFAVKINDLDYSPYYNVKTTKLFFSFTFVSACAPYIVFLFQNWDSSDEAIRLMDRIIIWLIMIFGLWIPFDVFSRGRLERKSESKDKKTEKKENGQQFCYYLPMVITFIVMSALGVLISLFPDTMGELELMAIPPVLAALFGMIVVAVVYYSYNYPNKIVGKIILSKAVEGFKSGIEGKAYRYSNIIYRIEQTEEDPTQVKLVVDKITVKNGEIPIENKAFDSRFKTFDTIDDLSAGAVKYFEEIKKERDDKIDALRKESKNEYVQNVGCVSDNLETESLFQKLTPVENADLGIYTEALDYVFQKRNGDIVNIALTGNYSSGKSSIINSYEKKTNKRFIHISLTHFNRTKQADEELVEKEIINQLIQQIPVELIPGTRFKIQRDFNWIHGVLFSVLFVAFIVSGFFIYNYLELLKTPEEQILSNHPWGYLLGSVGVFCGTFVTFCFFIIKWQKQNHIIRKVSFKGNEIELEEQKEDKSFFNRHIDEILYVLEKISQDNRAFRVEGIVFEDLDRIKKSSVNPKIFEKLRELCILANKRAELKGKESRPIRFFYLISDSTFASKERTKFFDYIIPIIPVVDMSNAYPKLKECLEEANCFKGLDEKFLRKISLFFDDYRVIKNVVNEFKIYKSELSNTSHDLDTLLGIIVYKNYFPEDFARLQRQDGYVYEVFKKRNELIEMIKEGIDSKIADNDTVIEKIKSEYEASKKKYDDEYEDRKANEFTGKYTDYSFDDWYYMIYEPNCSDLKDDYDARMNKKDRDNRELNEERKRLRNEPFKNLIKRAKDEEREKIFDCRKWGNRQCKGNMYESLQDNRYYVLILFLFQLGHLDDLNYRDYIAYFDERGMAKEDKEFLIGVNCRRGKEFDYRIIDTELVCGELSDDDFSLKETRNIYLTDYLIRARSQNKLKKFIDQLIYNSDYEYVTYFLRNAGQYKDAVCFITESSPEFLCFLLPKDGIYYVPEDDVNRAILTVLSCNDDTELEIKKEVKRYLSEDAQGLTCDTDDVDTITINLEMQGEVKFRDIKEQIASKDLREGVIESNLYNINYDNLYYILVEGCNYRQQDVESRLLTKVQNCGRDYFKQYVFENLNIAVKEVVKNARNRIMDDESVIKIIAGPSSQVDENTINEYLDKNGRKIPDLSVIDKKFWVKIAQRDQYTKTIENIKLYYNEYGLDENLINNIKHSRIESIFTTSVKNEQWVNKLWEDVYKKENIDDDIYRRLVRAIGSKIQVFSLNSNDLSEKKCKLLIDNGLIDMTPHNLQNIRLSYPNLTVDYIASDVDAYMSITSRIKPDPVEVDKMLGDNRIPDQVKITLLRKTIHTKYSVIGKQLSDSVFKEILLGHFNTDDLRGLILEYDSFDDERQRIIDEIVYMDSDLFVENIDAAADGLIIKFFQNVNISRMEKAKALSAMIKGGKPDEICKRALTAAGNDQVKRLFGKARNAFEIDRNDENVAYLNELAKIGKVSSEIQSNGKIKVKRTK